MRLRAPLTIAASIAACLALVAGSVGAGSRAAGGESAGAEGADEARSVTVRDGRGGAWSVRLAPPAARDLVLTATYSGARGEHHERVMRIEGAAMWWPTIAPLDRGVRVEGDHVVIDVTRLGFREYPVARFVVAK
jgi:hypothetical protein